MSPRMGDQTGSSVVDSFHPKLAPPPSTVMPLAAGTYIESHYRFSGQPTGMIADLVVVPGTHIRSTSCPDFTPDISKPICLAIPLAPMRSHSWPPICCTFSNE